MRKFILTGAVALAAVSTAAYATVTLNDDGTGFVGKGDVQTAYGWNNAAMQRNYLDITFEVDSSLSYEVTCEWETVTGGKNSKTITHTVTNKRKLNSTLAVDATVKKTSSANYTGWFLNGYADGGSSNLTLPSVGDSCPQGGSASDNDPPANDAVITDVSSDGGLTGTLSAVHPTAGARVIYSF